MTEWMQQAVALAEGGRIDAALDVLFDAIDDPEIGGRFEEVNALLVDPSTAQLHTDLLIGMLVTTLPCKSKLPARPAYCEAVRLVLIERHEDVDALLDGLT